MSKVQLVMKSKIGPLHLVATPVGLCGVHWLPQPVLLVDAIGESDPRTVAILEKAKTQILEYLDGERTKFDLPMYSVGTQFQSDVWSRINKIPYGETEEYNQIAEAIGRPKASRAVGNASGLNPMPIVVPCHRVVGAAGIGHYTGPAGMKEKLLELERRTLCKKSESCSATSMESSMPNTQASGKSDPSQSVSTNT